MVTAYDFVAAASATFEEDVPLADTSLDIAAGMTPGARRAVIDALVAAQPPDLVAHRLGDFVFTYHGVDWRDADDSLWLVIMSPDPAANAGSSNGQFVVGLADGSVETIEEPDFPARRREQNTLRAEKGLAPLPDPSEVTHAVPATVGPGGP